MSERSRLLLFAVSLALTASIAQAAERPASQADMTSVQEQARTFDKDLSILKETATIRLDGQDKRIGDLGIVTAQQANYIAVTGVAITLMVCIAGLITYLSATSKAIKEANEAAEKWFEKNAAEYGKKLKALQDELDMSASELKRLRDECEAMLREMATLEASVKDKAEQANKNIAEYSRQILASATATSGTRDTPPSSVGPGAIAFTDGVTAVQEASQDLRAKPETSLTADNDWTRGLADYSNEQFESALQAFRNGLARIRDMIAERDKYGQLLFSVGATLTRLHRSDEAIAVYDDLIARFSDDPSPTMREQVAKALLNKGYRLGTLGRPDEEMATYDDVIARFGDDPLPAPREQVARALLNKGYRFGQVNQPDDELAAYDEGIRRFADDPPSCAIRLPPSSSTRARHSASSVDPTKRSRCSTTWCGATWTIRRSSCASRWPRACSTRPSRWNRAAASMKRSRPTTRWSGASRATPPRACSTTSRGRWSTRAIDSVTWTATKKRSRPTTTWCAGMRTSRPKRCATADDTSELMRDRVTRALNGAAYNRIMAAKRDWLVPGSRVELLGRAVDGLGRATSSGPSEARPIAYGNLGYAHLLLGQSAKAEAATREGLTRGGNAVLSLQRADAKRLRVEPEDTEYEALLSRLWAELPADAG